MAKVIGVKFKNTAKIYYFAPKDNEEYKEGDGVIVETAKGIEFGTVAFGVKEVEEENVVAPLKQIMRKATNKDIKAVKDNEAMIPEAMSFASEKIRELGLEMKLIGAEVAFDGKKLVFFFSADNRIDFRELVKALAGHFHARIELRQIGIRDETKILGGIAPCGRTCCCASCMPDFGKVTVKMAKNQGLHLNPSKISGLCGRLMCCLEYENDYYAEVYGKMPKVGGTVKSPEGEGVVVSNDMLKLISKIKISKGDGSDIYKDFPVDQLEFKRKTVAETEENTENVDICKGQGQCKKCKKHKKHKGGQNNNGGKGENTAESVYNDDSEENLEELEKILD